MLPSLMKPENIETVICGRAVLCDPYGDQITPSYVKAFKWALTSCIIEVTRVVIKHVA